jgi:hypothetical protein
MSGFVYIWYDCKHKRYYLGSHWGIEDDGYICSSTNMRNNYRNRPQDFKRRILTRITTNRIELFKEEQRWLDMIRSYDLGRKYYNLNSTAKGFGWMGDEATKQIKEKLSKSMMGNTNGSQVWTEAQKEKNKASYQYERTEAQVKATKKNQKKGAEASPITKKGWIPKHRIGVKHSPETLEKMRAARLNYYATASAAKLKKHGDAISKGKTINIQKG